MHVRSSRPTKVTSTGTGLTKPATNCRQRYSSTQLDAGRAELQEQREWARDQEPTRQKWDEECEDRRQTLRSDWNSNAKTTCGAMSGGGRTRTAGSRRT